MPKYEKTVAVKCFYCGRTFRDLEKNTEHVCPRCSFQNSIKQREE